MLLPYLVAYKTHLQEGRQISNMMMIVVFFFSVDAGHRAVIFDRFMGVKQAVIGEGTHFFIPWVQRPIMFDARTRPRNIPVVTGSKGEYFKIQVLYHLSIKLGTGG